MKRRTFLISCATAGLAAGGPRPWKNSVLAAPATLMNAADSSLVGQPVDLAPYGEWQSWLCPEATRLLEPWLGEAGQHFT